MTVPVQLMTAMAALHIPMTSRPALVAAITSGALHGTLTNGAYMVLEDDVSAYVTANPGVLTPPAAPAAPAAPPKPVSPQDSRFTAYINALVAEGSMTEAKAQMILAS